MAKRKKQRTTPAATASESLGGRRPAFLALGGAAVVSAVAAAVVLFLAFSGGGDSQPQDDGVKTAVIVDQLELTQPNPEFVSEARGLLADAGYAVDYVPGANVTVEFYRTLPDKHYDLVLLRVHAGITTEVSEDGREPTEYVSLFTGEPYDETKYPDEMLNRLGKARYTPESDPLFGIGPEFVKQSMEGNFNEGLVVMMGCDGLRSQITGQAFLDKGASGFVSWSNEVSADHTDETTLTLLQHMLIDQQPLEQAVQATAEEVGPDPAFDAELRLLTG